MPDVNLRAPYYTADVLYELMLKASQCSILAIVVTIGIDDSLL